MKILQLTEYARARVWFDRSVCEYSQAGSLKTVLHGEPTAHVSRQHIVVEAFVPRGGLAQYGLLGLQFDKAKSMVLRVEVPYSEGAADPWPGSLASGVDDVRLGLPREYAHAILNAAAVSAERRFPPGAIKAVEAAHGQVGSSTRFFESLATCVIELMQDECSEDQTVRLLRARLVDMNFGVRG